MILLHEMVFFHFFCLILSMEIIHLFIIIFRFLVMFLFLENELATSSTRENKARRKWEEVKAMKFTMQMPNSSFA